MQKATKTLLLLAVGAVTVSTVLNSCKSKDTPLPAIGGYNSSDDVSSTNLLAHWSFEGNLNEAKSGTAPSTSNNISYTTGVRGQAAMFNNGYAVYPTIAAMSTSTAFANGFTISSWVKVPNTDSQTSSVFSLTKAQNAQMDWNDGPLNYYLETGSKKAASDTFFFHSAFHTYPNGTSTGIGGDNINNYGRADTDFQYVIVPGNKWIHYVAEYDASTSRIDLYANGVLVSNSNFALRQVGGVNIGSLTIPTPTQVILGAFPNANDGYPNAAVHTFERLLNGAVDELRVYNKPLSTADISALYQLELVGR